MKRIFLYLIALLFSVGLFAQPISLNSTNPRYFTYRGEPIVIVTSAEHYGAVLNTDFDNTTYLQALADDGLNGTRLSSGVNVEYQGWYDMPENTWAPAVGSYLCPWARSSTPGYYNGGNKFDLTSWDNSYFNALKNFVEAAAALDIIVELFFFSYVYDPGGDPDELWDYNPMKLSNNINGIGDVIFEDVYTTSNTSLLNVQKEVVEKIVTELNAYDNLIYEIINEPYMWPPVSDAWSDTIIKVITETEALLSKQHLISQNTNNFSYTITSPNASTDLFNLHYARTGEAYTDNYSVGKALGCNETGDVTGGGENEEQYRQECYIALTSGAAYFNNLDFSFTVGDEEGTTLPTGARASGGPTMRAQIKLAKDFIESFDFIDMAPDNTVINSITSGTDAYCLAEDSEQYAIFIDGVAGFIQLDLPVNTYTVTWIDTKTGVETSNLLRHTSDLVTLYPPSYTEDISLSIINYTAPFVPSTPQSVHIGGLYAKINNNVASYLAPGTDTTYIPPHPDQIKVFDDTITMVYTPISTGGYGFYWWHRPDEEGITEFGDMPTANWEAPNNYRDGEFTLSVEVISQPTTSPFYIQFGIWQDYGVSNYPETVADRKYVEGGAGATGSWNLGSPSTWWNKEPTDSVDFSRADDFFRIGVVLWNPSPLCIPKGTAWGSDGCPEYAYKFFPLEIVISVYASSDSVSVMNAPTNMVFSSVTTSSMRIGWTDNSSNEDNFEIQRSLTDGSGYSTIASPTNSYYDDSSLDPGTTYYYRVRAVNTTGETDWLTSSRTTATTSPIDYTILWEEDFDDFAVQSTLSEDTLNAHVDNFESAGSTGGDGIYQQLGIVSFDGSNVMESRYPIGQCCTDGGAYGGTGGDWRAWITSGGISNPFRRLVMSMNFYLDPLFENSQGFKLPALCTEKGSGWDNGTGRIMILDWSLYGEFEPSYYTHAYWSGYGGNATIGSHTKTQDPATWFPRGQWINVTLVMDAGTVGSANGWMELFIDGELIDSDWEPDTEKSVPFIDAGDASGWTYIEFTTFMGGNGTEYLSPRSQYMYLDDAIIYYLDNDGDYTYPSVPGDSIYLPPEANWPR